mmetsp:Transcript_4233/g.11646  ORF Transcript_4233/g.11646 Transcript_4233/m.11646 type:complete len:399 (+) Transcript_4233:137-1333(+)
MWTLDLPFQVKLVQWRCRFDSPLEQTISTESDGTSSFASLRSSILPAHNTPSRSTAAITPSPASASRSRHRSPTTPPSVDAFHNGSPCLSSWDMATSIELYILHRRLIRADCRLQPIEEQILLQAHLDSLALAAGSGTLTGTAALIAAELAAYHDALVISILPPTLATASVANDEIAPHSPSSPEPHGRRLYSQMFRRPSMELSPLSAAIWFDEVITLGPLFQRATPEDPGALQQSNDALVLRPPSVRGEVNFAGDGALRRIDLVAKNLSLETHFVELYELITGQAQLSLSPDRDSSITMGAMLLRALPAREWENASSLGANLCALLEVLVHQREQMQEGVPRDALDGGLAEKLPSYRDLREEETQVRALAILYALVAPSSAWRIAFLRGNRAAIRSP